MSAQITQKTDSAPASAYTASGSSPPSLRIPNPNKPGKRTAPQFGASTASSALKAGASLTQKPLFTPIQQQEKVSLKTLAGPASISQTLRDIAGVWAPKLIVLRSPFQFFEETFLEFVEDLAFYFSTALAGYGLHKPMAKLAKLAKDSGSESGQKIAHAIGKGLAGKTKKEDASKELIAAKMGTVLGALSIGAGFEFMIQHVKNVISAKQLHVRNFTAVAGLEDPQETAAQGETDPVVKAKKRAKQVAALTAAGVGLAFLAPLAVRNNKTAEAAARKVLSYVDFGSKKPFDLSKAFLAILAGVGAASYIDASRDNLERKENATRLSVVIPYMIFGNELMNFGLAKYKERFGKLEVDGQKVAIKDLKKELGFSFTDGNPLKKARQKESFLNMDVLRDSEGLRQHFNEITQEYLAKNPDQAKRMGEVERALQANLAGMGKSAFFLSAATTGILINVIAYAMTRERYQKMQQSSDDSSTASDQAANNSKQKGTPPAPPSLAHIQTAPLPLPPSAFSSNDSPYPTPWGKPGQNRQQVFAYTNPVPQEKQDTHFGKKAQNKMVRTE